MSSRKRRTWVEKLEDAKDLPKVIPAEQLHNTRWGSGSCAIPAPLEVDALMRRVRKGKVTTTNELRAAVARMHQADFACPITTGIFAWIAAHAAEERAAGGMKRVTPWWRTLKSGGELNPKFPGGIDEQRRRLAAEGHRFEQRGKRVLLAEHERALAEFTD